MDTFLVLGKIKIKFTWNNFNVANSDIVGTKHGNISFHTKKHKETWKRNMQRVKHTTMKTSTRSCFFWIFFVFLGSLHTLLLSYYMKGSLLFIRHFQRYALPFSNSFCWFGEKMVEVVSHGVTHVEQFSYLHILYVGLELQDQVN